MASSSSNSRHAVDAARDRSERSVTSSQQHPTRSPRVDDGDRRRRRDDRGGHEPSPRRRDSSGSEGTYRHRRRRDGRGDGGDGRRSEHRRRRERSRSRERSPPRRRSRSPAPRRPRRSYSRSRSPPRRSHTALPSQDASFRREIGAAGPPNDGAPEKQKPNFKPTGLLAKEANTVAGTSTVLKYHEPPEARKPPAKEKWRMYVFKKKDLLDTVHLHQRSCWLMGRDQKVTDLLLEHPSVSKQHAVIQFRYLTTTNEYGDRMSRVKPYLIDLESANGTCLNGNKIETSRFVELVDADVISFGDSDREYVLMLPPIE